MKEILKIRDGDMGREREIFEWSILEKIKKRIEKGELFRILRWAKCVSPQKKINKNIKKLKNIKINCRFRWG